MKYKKCIISCWRVLILPTTKNIMKMRNIGILLLGLFYLSLNVCIAQDKSDKTTLNSDENIGAYDFYSNHKCGNKEKKYIYPIEVFDSIIGDYQISYKVLTNVAELIPSKYIINLTGDTLYYAGTDILLCLKKNGKIYFEKRINKKEFYHFLEKKDIPYYSINAILIEEVKNDRVYFFINLCIPDTDICYDFILEVGDDGDMNIKESCIESEMFE